MCCSKPCQNSKSSWVSTNSWPTVLNTLNEDFGQSQAQFTVSLVVVDKAVIFGYEWSPALKVCQFRRNFIWQKPQLNNSYVNICVSTEPQFVKSKSFNSVFKLDFNSQTIICSYSYDYSTSCYMHGDAGLQIQNDTFLLISNR